MRTLDIYIEIAGSQRFVGELQGNTYQDAVFQYAKEYLDSGYAVPISISLPLQAEAFSAEKTRIFFEGLLPEGFSRRAVASWIKAQEDDYLSILSVLGRECLGAIKVVDSEVKEIFSEYEKLDLPQVKALAAEGATKSTQILMETHLSLTGASGKVGLYHDQKTDSWYLPKGDAPSTHIVKQSHVRLSNIVVNEQLCMLTARNLGIEVPNTFIINAGNGSDADVLYATERYDRVFSQNRIIDGLPVPNRLHQEDFAQALGLPFSDKYEKGDSGYLRRMFDLIKFNCSDPLADLKKLWTTICFDFLIGNTDCHVKNFSLLYNDNLRHISLAPAYDIVSTTVYQMTRDMSFFIGDSMNIGSINRASFAAASKEISLPEKIAMALFDELANSFEGAISKASEELEAGGFDVVSKIRDDVLRTGGYANL